MSGGGSAGGGGYDFHARIIAFVSVYILGNRALGWFKLQTPDVPKTILAETKGPGDDLRVELKNNLTKIEVQVKRGLNADYRLYEAVKKFAGMESDSNILGVLAVDTTASKTIRSYLKDGLKRIEEGRTDDLKEVTRKVIDCLATKTSSPYDVLKRLTVIEFDVENDSSPLRQTAIEILRNLLANPEQAPTAWALLVEDGLRLIKERGRRDIDSLVRLFGSNDIQFANATVAGTISYYIKWLKENTATFRVTGLKLALPIEEAWVRLRALDDNSESPQPTNLKDKIASYHEWGRLSYRDHIKDAQDIVEFGYRVVIVGGPGSGKTTLCRHSAYNLNLQGEKVLWVRLPKVIRHVRAGSTVDEAILKVATDGCGISFKSVYETYNHADCLIADGLDECSPYVNQTVEELKKWASGRMQTRVIITTRPIGYDPALFNGWRHAEFLPLDPSTVVSHARKLISYCIDDSEEADKALQWFEKQLKNNKVASIAARSPLLLGFLIRLSISGVEFGRYRGTLYQQVLQQIYASQEREYGEQMEEALAFRALDIIGWTLQNAYADGTSCSKEDIINRVAGKLMVEMGITQLNAEITAEKCIKFWQERGILEYLTVEYDATYTFVHLSFCEYTAGKYASRLKAKTMDEWLEKVRRVPSWRETILLAAGSGAAEDIIEKLLMLDDSKDPVSTEAVLAAAVLSETKPSKELANKVVRYVTQRLTSTVPLIVYEAGKSIIPIASQVPELVKSVVEGLYGHPQVWTRLVAIRLAIAAGPDIVDLDILEECFDNQPSRNSAVNISRFELSGYDEWGEWNDIIANGAEVLKDMRPGDATVERISKLVQDGRISVFAVEALSKVLIDIGHEDVLKEEGRKFAEEMNSFLNPERFRAGDMAFIEAVIRVAGNSAELGEKLLKFVTLGKLIHGLGLPEFEAGAWAALGRKPRDGGTDFIREAALDAVLLGAIKVFKSAGGRSHIC